MKRIISILVIVAGLLIEAGATNSPVLVQVGRQGSSSRHSSNPTLLSDVFAELLSRRLAIENLKPVFPGFVLDERRHLGIVA